MKESCSAFLWETLDNKHLFARNYDFNRVSEGTSVIYVPNNYEYYTMGTKLENDLLEENKRKSKYRILGIGTTILEPTPALYEGMNEMGLCGAQLYYRNFAHFSTELKENTYPVQPPFFVMHALATCKDVLEVKKMLEEDISLVGKPLLGTVPTIHFIFGDKKGNNIIVEPDVDGIKIYDKTIGVMTNSPSYKWHELNLLNYVNLRNLDYDTLKIENVSLEQCFSGSGMLGLPGDFTSPSRFVRLALFKKYASKGKNEVEGVNYLFRLMQNVSFPLGMVLVSNPGEPTSKDKGVVPFDYTVYTSVMSLDLLCFYWTTYDNNMIRFVDMKKHFDSTKIITFNLEGEVKFQEIK